MALGLILKTCAKPVLHDLRGWKWQHNIMVAMYTEQRSSTNYLGQCNDSVYNSVFIQVWVENGARDHTHKLRLQHLRTKPQFTRNLVQLQRQLLLLAMSFLFK